MMRKNYLLTMMMALLGLFAGVSAMQAQDLNPELDCFWARLTAKPSAVSLGSGQVFVSTDGSATPNYQTVSSSADGYSEIFLMSSIVKSDVRFYAWAKADDGSYFTGWSFTDGYTDLGDGEGSSLSVDVTPSSKRGDANIRKHIIYASFEPIKIESYEITGDQNTSLDEENWTCTQTVKFTAKTPGAYGLSNVADVRHFKLPVLTRKAGTAGTWTTSVAEWEPNVNIFIYGDYAELYVPVTFTAPNGDAGEYGATLTLETYAGVKNTVYLYARTVEEGDEAIRYNKNKTEQARGAFEDLLENAEDGDIIKLNGDYSSAITINKNITFDLNGYTLSSTLTVSGGNVTLAYSPYGGSITGAVSVTGGKLTLNGGKISGAVSVGAGAELVLNGAAITKKVTNAGIMTVLDGSIKVTVNTNGEAISSTGTLLVNGGIISSKKKDAIVIGSGEATIKRGTVSSDTKYGINVSNGSVAIEKLAEIKGGNKALNNSGGTVVVYGGMFTDLEEFANGEITFHSAYFQTNRNEETTIYGKPIWRNTVGPEYRNGYNFFAGNQEAAQAANVSVCRIGNTAYSSLEEALAYANNSGAEAFIIMENDYTLKAGYYTLPANATLIVPMSDEQETDNAVVPRSTDGTPAPVSFRKLIFDNGVNMTVSGTIELTCTQHGSGETMGIPGGNYGHLIMKPGSHMTINNGGELRAWGFVTGDGTKDANGTYLSGEIDARRGAVVREMFQMGDWKGGDISFTMIVDQWPQNLAHLFPVYTYFIQNVESPVKYHPGSSLLCTTSVNVVGNINAYANDIKVVGKEGEPAMFLMDEMADAENTWVRKWYDAAKDQQVYEVNSGAQLGSMVIDLGKVPASLASIFQVYEDMDIVLDSRKFVLPLTNNFKIHLLSGKMEFTQSTSCLPGMEVEVDKESEISIVRNEDQNVRSGALYFYDADQWSFLNNQMKGYVGNSGRFGALVNYSATWDIAPDKDVTQPNIRDISSPEAIGDAKLIVHGTFRSADGCSVYTTWSKGTGETMEDNPFAIYEAGTGGASIISTNADAGTFIFEDDSPAFEGVQWDDPANTGNFEHLTGFGNSVLVNYDHNYYGSDDYPIIIETVRQTYQPMYGWELCTPAKLKNGDGTFVATEGSPAGKSYCYMNDQWTSMEVFEDNDCFMVDNYGTLYAKPAEYVAVNATVVGGKVVGNDDHTFSDAAGAGRLFILMKDDCQWWEVEKKDNLYHCIHPNNDTYYYWDDSNANPNKHKWAEKHFTITWLNWDGEEIKSTINTGGEEDEEVAYSVTYGTMAEYLGSNPTRAEDIDYTYDFTGWSPALGKVTSDVIYTATYEAQPRKYTIIFMNEGNIEIERHFLTHNEVPVCENTPTRPGCTLEWSPAIAAVTGDATYTATWLEEPPTEYAVTFFDYDGTTILKPAGVEPYMVAVGAMPTPPASVDGKEPTAEYTYVFDHWSPALEVVSATSIKSYTAVYREEARKYTISYYMEDGTTLNTTEELPYGATPTPPDVTKENPETGHTYTLVWKNLEETGAIQTVMGSASYKPTYLDVLNKYTVTVKSNPSGACSITGAGLYDYNTSATLTLGVNSGYTFTGWSDGQEGTYTTRTIDVTEDKELVANFTVADPDWTITWKNEAGTANLVAPVGQKSGTATIYTGAIPTKDAADEYTYSFYGWSSEANGAGTIYKNGLTPAATANATYYAYFTPVVRQYQVTLTSNIPNVCMLVGAGTYDYSSAWENAEVIVSGYNATNYSFDGWYNTSDELISSLESYSFAVQSDVNLVAKFSEVTYTVTWKDEDGTVLETDADQAYGAATAFNDSEPTKAGYSFIGWTTNANGAGSFYTKGATPAVTGNAEYYAYYVENAQNLVIGVNGSETLAGPTDYANFVITSDGEHSGQLINAQHLSVLGEAIFRMDKSFAAGQWYAVAVPWRVDPNTGIYAGDSRLDSGSDIYIIDFDANVYASADKQAGRRDYWKFLDETGADMLPGKLYMIYLTSAQTSIDFHKKAGASIATTTTSVATASGTEPSQSNWNAIANPALYHADLSTGVAMYQTYDNNDGQTYTVVDGETEDLIVAKPIFVQVTTPSTVYATVHSGGGSGAPAYRSAQQAVNKSKFVVEIACNDKMTDRIIVETADEKEDRYVIGQDLAKFGVSSKVAQIWVNRYDAKLCANTVEMMNEQAEYPLSIYAPASGEYTLSAMQKRGDANLYLTYNGEAIWNLNDGAYTLNLERGTDTNYGLRISARAPQGTTGIDEAVVDAQGETRKMLIDNQVFIIRGEKVYTIDGQLVK